MPVGLLLRKFFGEFFVVPEDALYGVHHPSLAAIILSQRSGIEGYVGIALGIECGSCGPLDRKCLESLVILMDPVIQATPRGLAIRLGDKAFNIFCPRLFHLALH